MYQIPVALIPHVEQLVIVILAPACQHILVHLQTAAPNVQSIPNVLAILHAFEKNVGIPVREAVVSMPTAMS